MKFCTVLAFLLLGTTVAATAAGSVTLDGKWWSSASQDAKVYVIQGIIDGLESGFGAGALVASATTGKLDAATAASKWAPQYSKTFGTYVTLIDAIEKDPGAANLRLSRIMLCLSDNAIAVGTTDSCVKGNEGH